VGTEEGKRGVGQGTGAEGARGLGNGVKVSKRGRQGMGLQLWA